MASFDLRAGWAATPPWLKRAVPRPLKRAVSARLKIGQPPPPSPSAPAVRALMDRYRTDSLVGVTETAFRTEIERFLQLKDVPFAGTDAARQYTFGRAFQWGHDHDFGSFQIPGRMRDRHIRHIATFIDEFGALSASLEGASVLDIGCWTGGASLLLSAMGAQVTAIDDVGMYVDCLNYLARSLGNPRIEAHHRSLYGCTRPDLQDRFDFVLLAGVLYHVTDPIVALRIVFNCLRDGGICLLETTGVRSRKATISYERRLWNWFDLSPAALRLMMADVGFTDVRVGAVTRNERMYAVARRERHVDMRRDGLSMPDLR